MFCRLCLLNLHEDIGLPLFNSHGESALVKIITKFLHLELTQHDAVSTVICNDCWQHLDDFEKFYKYVEKKQATLCNEFLEIKSATAHNIEASTLLDLEKTQLNETIGDSIENNEESLLDIKDVLMANVEAQYNEDEEQTEKAGDEEKEFGYADHVADDNADNTSDDDIPLKNLFKASKSTKTIKTNKKALKTVKKQSKTKDISTKKSAKTHKTTKRAYNKRAKETVTLNKTKDIKHEEGKEGEEEEADKNENSNAADETNAKNTRNYKAKMLNNDEFIAKHMQLKCNICELSLEKFSAVRAHYRAEHSCKGYVMCCEKRFAKRILLVDHINVHLNPLYFLCNICGKSLNSRCSLDSHMTNTHPKSDKLKYHCTFCGKRFVRKSNFDVHSVTHQIEKKSTCKICQKSFANDNRLRYHMKVMHSEGALSICNFCGRQFRCKQSFARHVDKHQGIYEPPVQCSTCNVWVRSKLALRKHMDMHNPIEAKCEICGRICYTKSALQTHVKYTHRIESKFPCTFCDKRFKKPSYLREHMAMHTGEKLHKCAHCSREFRSKANMYVHIKRNHVDEWLQAKVAKTRTMEMHAQQHQQQQEQIAH